MRLYLLVCFWLVLSCSYLLAQQGVLYELDKIEFTGNSEFSSSDLKTIIYSEETPWWFYKFLNSFTGFGKPPVYFDSSYIQIDLDALKAYYNANGYFKSSFSYKYSLDTTAKKVTLTYVISENDQSNFGQMRYRGLDSIPVNIMQRIYSESYTDTSQEFNEAKLQQTIAHTLDILLNRGYMFAAHDSTVIIIDTTTNYDATDVYITTGKRYKISEVEVNTEGNGAPYVSDKLLVELTEINKEEYYNREKIKNSQNRLVRTGLFNSVIVNVDKKDTNGIHVPVKIEGNIGSMNEFVPGISVSDELRQLNLVLNANYSRKNFLGDARKLTLTTEIGIADIVAFSFKKFFSQKNYNIDGIARISLKVEQPYLFRRPIHGTLENYFETQTFSNINQKTYGIKATFDFELPAYTFINQFKPYYNLEFLDYKASDQKEGDIYISHVNLSYATSFLGMYIGSAKSNNFFFPTSGRNQLLNFETAVSNVFGTSSLQRDGSVAEQSLHETSLFYRVEFTSSLYFPTSLDQMSVLAVKNKIGYVQTFKGGSELIPANKTFTAGGSNSVRGWQARELVPSTASEHLSVNDSTSVAGGTFLFEGSFELRKRFLESFGFVLFTDYGSTWNGYKQFRFDETAVAAGFGFRYYSAIAPFRIDFGFKVYDPKDKLFIWNNWKPAFFKNLQFHFGIGEAF